MPLQLEGPTDKKKHGKMVIGGYSRNAWSSAGRASDEFVTLCVTQLASATPYEQFACAAAGGDGGGDGGLGLGFRV